MGLRWPNTWRANDWFTISTRPVSKSSGWKSRPATTEVPKAEKKPRDTCTSVLTRRPVAGIPVGKCDALDARLRAESSFHLIEAEARAGGKRRRVGSVPLAVHAHARGQVSLRADTLRSLPEPVGLEYATGGEREERNGDRDL